MSSKSREAATASSAGGKTRAVLITGGSGFIGANLAASYLQDGEDVILLDNLSRPGVEQNLAWLKDRYGTRVHPLLADVRDYEAICSAVAEAKAVFHLAGQTAVTTSLVKPFDDFEINARGTLNVLEAIRRSGRRIPVVFASTNKVYGSLGDLEMIELEDRYLPTDKQTRRFGIGEGRSLSLCTPYGCSKGVADQYVLDYAVSYGVPSAVLRMSCVYGPHQFGTEDQGWVAHFLICALNGQPVTIYGDGKQVRDILHVGDAVAAYRGVMREIDAVGGLAFNLGGGPPNAVSLRLVLQKIARVVGRELEIGYEDWRAGDQLFFVADTRRLTERLGWRARMPWGRGLEDLAGWLRENRGAARLSDPQRAEA